MQFAHVNKIVKWFRAEFQLYERKNERKKKNMKPFDGHINLEYNPTKSVSAGNLIEKIQKEWEQQVILHTVCLLNA